MSGFGAWYMQSRARFVLHIFHYPAFVNLLHDITRLVSRKCRAGAGPELEEITGFDEGPVHPDWRRELEKRGIEVEQDILRQEAIAVYREFALSRQFVYHARLGSS